MNWQTAKEVITIVLSIFGAVGLVVTPIVVAIINNRPKKEEKAKEAEALAAPVVSGMPVNLEYQSQTNVLLKYMEDVIESKNDVENRLSDSETRERILKEENEALRRALEKYKDIT